MKREVEIVVLSDIHLGTYGCKAKELLYYLSTISPKCVVLNGDIIDIWQFSKRYFPKAHLKVIRKILKYATNGIPVYYLPGNHDESIRRYIGLSIGNIHIKNKLLWNINNENTWIFHGDVFDMSMKYSKIFAKLGGLGYDMLIQLNTVINWCLHKLGRPKYSFSKKIKNGIKTAIKYINDFETTATDIAMDREYDYVICGHIHKAEIKEFNKHNRKVVYMNSGDWVESLTSLEYYDKKWHLIDFYKEYEGLYNADATDVDDIEIEIPELNSLYEDIIRSTGNRQWAFE